MPSQVRPHEFAKLYLSHDLANVNGFTIITTTLLYLVNQAMTARVVFNDALMSSSERRLHPPHSSSTLINTFSTS